MDAATPRTARRPAPHRSRGTIGAVGRAAGRGCSRPGCATPAAATLLFSYHEQVARIVDLIEDVEPQAYDLCDPHAARTSPPRAWELRDERPVRATATPPRLDDTDGTVAILAAALRGGAVAPVDGVPADDAPAVDAPAVTHDPTPAREHHLPASTGGVEEDPLRAALEELQRLGEPEPTAVPEEPLPAPTPLVRRRRVLIVDADDPDAEPTLW